MAAVLLGVVLLVANGTFVRADDAVERYFQALRERRLFTLAENYCLDQLARERLPLADRTSWTIELSRTFAEHARYVPGDEQKDYWNRAEQVLEDLLAAEPKNPRRLQLEAQIALTRTSKAEFLASLAELYPDDEGATAQAVEALSEAVGGLKDAERPLAAAANARVKPPAALEGGPTVLETRHLLETIRFTLGTVLLQEARLLPRSSPERAAALVGAEEIVRRLAGGIPGEAMTWNGRVLLAESARLRGDVKQTLALITSMEKENPPVDVLDRLLAVQMRTLLDQGRPDEAVSRLVAYQKQRSPLPGELAYLKTAALLRLWEIADQKKSPELAEDLWKEAEFQANAAEQLAGGWWGYRSRIALESARENRTYGRELASLTRQARLAATPKQAIEAAGKAAVLAARDGHDELAVELGLARGSMLLREGRFSEAKSDFQAVAARFPMHAKAAEADLLAAYCLGRLYETERTTERREEYLGLLQSHRDRYAESPTFGEATWMLAAVQERRLQYTKAVPLYGEIPFEHPRGPEARVAIARCWEQILSRAREIQQSPGEWEAKAVAQLDGILKQFPPSPAPLARSDAEVCLRAARIHLDRTAPDYVSADRLLERVLVSAATRKAKYSGELPADSPDGGEAETVEESAAWATLKKMATQLRIVSLAGQKKWFEAEKLVQALSDAGPAEVLAVLDGLASFGRTADPATQRGLGELQLKTVDALAQRKEQLTEHERDRLEECRAQALAATNQPKAAIPVYEAMLAKDPKDDATRRMLAELLSRCGTVECWKKARAHWKQLESAQKPGTGEWFNARYENARAALGAGEVAECRKLLGVTRVLYPQLGGAEMAARFAALERQATEQAGRR